MEISGGLDPAMPISRPNHAGDWISDRPAEKYILIIESIPD
jgi:hypothetical protein